MGWTTAAIIGSAVIGGIASNKAASAQKSAAAQAGAVSERQYDLTREDLAPWRQIGGQAIGELGALYGFPQNQLAGNTIDEAGNPVDPEPSNGLAARRDPANQIAPPSPGNVMITDPRYQDGETIMYGDPRYGGADPYKGLTSVNPTTGAQEFYSSNNMAQYGRGGDTEMAHVTPGEMVVPRSVANQPGVRNRLAQGFKNEGMDPSRYVVGGRNSLNPYTGRAEFKYGADTNEGGATGFSTGNPRDTDQGQDRMGRNRFSNRLGGQSTNPAQGTASPVPDDYYTQDAAIGRFYDSPDYQINFDEGAKALEQSAAARGGLFSGNTGTALVRYGQDYGNRLYNQYANRLQSFAGFGQTAAAQTGQFGAYSAGQQGNALMAGGNAAAQGWIGMGNSINAGIGNAMYYNQVR